MTTRRVAVIGGGAAGLVAARRLLELGLEPLLLEATGRVGGIIATVHRDGWLAEAGPNTVMEPESSVRALLDRAGLADRMIHPSDAVKRRYLVHGGRLVPVPLSPGDLVATPLFSVAGRLRLLKEPFVAKGADDPNETVEAFARRRFGDEVATRLIDPLVSGTSGADPARMLVSFAFPQLVAYEQSAGSILKGAMRARSQARRRGEVLGGGLWSCPGGLDELANCLAASLGDRIRFGVVVRSVTMAGNGFEVVAADGQRERVDAVCFACPAAAFGALALDFPGGDAVGVLAAITHSSIATVSLGFRRDDVAHPLDGAGLLAPSSEGRRILGTLFASTLFPGRAPSGQVLLTAVAGGMRRPDVAAMPEGELEQLVRGELRDLLGATGEPTFRDVHRWEGAVPVATSGHAERLASIAGLEGAEPRLSFAGAWRDGLAVHEVMLGGLRAAERVAAALASA